MNTLSTATKLTLYALLLAAAGCANTPPSQFYMLEPISQAYEPPPADAARLSIGVGPAQIPEYLDRPQLVTRSATNTLELDEFHRWGGSLSSDLLRVVAQNLSVLTGSDSVFVYPWEEPIDPRYRVHLSILGLDGSLGGDVVLDAQWVVASRDRRQNLASGRSVIREPTRGISYQDFVAAQSRTLGTLSREIADEILNVSGRGGGN